tara:strand:- start:174 stop:365 length:192 start_codon:yes stop_codon:yes gene_type:complete
MSKQWIPEDEHFALVSRTIEFISDELDELQEAIRCPNSFIVEITNKIGSKYLSNETIVRRDEE